MTVPRPPTAKSHARICQDASTRSAPIRTASPPPHHLEESSRHPEAPRRTPLSHLQHTRPEQRQKRRVTRQDAHLAVVRRRNDRVGGPIEYRLLGRDDGDVHHSARGQTFCLVQGFIDPGHHVERLLGQLIELPRHHSLERADGVLELHVLAFEARELRGHEERLGQEALHPAGARHQLLVFFGQLVHSQDRDDVLQILVTLQDPIRRPRPRSRISMRPWCCPVRSSSSASIPPWIRSRHRRASWTRNTWGNATTRSRSRCSGSCSVTRICRTSSRSWEWTSCPKKTSSWWRARAGCSASCPSRSSWPPSSRASKAST